MFGPFPLAVPQFGDAIDQTGPQTKRYQRVISADCRTRTCVINFPPDIEVYSIQNALIFNETPLTFIVDCPVGRVCPPGTYPKTVTYPRGSFYIPDPNTNPGFPIYISLRGCQSTVTRRLEAGATQAQIFAATQLVLQEVARQQAECDSVEPPGPNPKPFFTNAAVYASFPCEECAVVDYDGVLPWYITLDRENNRLALAVGLIAADTQAAADAAAQTLINNFKAAAVAAGKLSCVTCTITTASPLPDGEEGTPYSTTLTAIDTFDTPVWTVTAGALPDGLTLNSATGEISGTPTVSGDFTFTVMASQEAQCCSKEFELEVGPVADCLITNSTPLPDGQVGVPYSDTINVSGLVGTPTFSITAGALPDGLSLNSATGEISGTPTMIEAANFAVHVETNLGQECTKGFAMEIVSAECIDWDNLFWGVPTLTQVNSGTASFTPNNTTGDTAVAAAACTVAAGSEGDAVNLASIAYNGPACDGKAVLTWTNPTPGSNAIQDGYIQIISTLNGSVLAVGIPSDLVSGVYEHTFTIPDTGGMGDIIYVSTEARASELDGQGARTVINQTKFETV